MKISELSVRRPTLISMVYILLLVIASLFVSDLDIALYPSVDMPVLSVMVSANDAGPEEIEQQVSKVLENSLGSLEGLESITSSSSTGRAMVMLEFAYGTDLDEATDDINSLLTRISNQLPDWAETPQIMRFDMSSSSTFMRMVISGSQDEDLLKQVAENTVSPLLLRIEGVSHSPAARSSTAMIDSSLSSTMP
ncbi:MAG: efflux RND transporter permease subunit [Sphaerochaeta sp.]|nr:efflux RND transporter permease subunit [Sphaerochaeta sp.]